MLREFPDSMIANTLHDLGFDVTMVEKSRGPGRQRGESIQDASVTMRLRSLEVPKWSLQDAIVGSVHVQQGNEGGGSIAEGATGNDGWTFYYQLRPVHANGQVATEDEVFAAPPGGEFCLACQPLHEWLTVFVPTSLPFP